MSILIISKKDVLVQKYRRNRLQIDEELNKQHYNILQKKRERENNEPLKGSREQFDNFLQIHDKLQILYAEKNLLNNYALGHSKEKLTKEQYEEYTTNGKNIGSFCYLATTSEQNNTCAICTSDFEIDEEILILHCKHIYHTNCINEWILHNPNCPYCRCDVKTIKDECVLS
jgi:hypothetical protein